MVPRKVGARDCLFAHSHETTAMFYAVTLVGVDPAPKMTATPELGL